MTSKSLRRRSPHSLHLLVYLCAAGLLTVLAPPFSNWLPALAGQIVSPLFVAWGAWLWMRLHLERKRSDELEVRCAEFTCSIRQLSHDSQRAATVAEQERIRRQQEEAHRAELSRLFLNLQHLGRELSGTLELGEISRLVTEAARKLLNAPNPRLFLLDEEAWQLAEHRSTSGERIPADHGILGWVVNHGQMITADDLSNIHSLAELQAQDPTMWEACAPLTVGHRVLGVLALDSIEQRPPEFERLLYILANFSAVALNNSQLFARVEHMARHDGLTGLLNHAAFQCKLTQMFDDARKRKRPLSVVIADLDHFKQINDRHLHQGGDHVLKFVADLWRSLIRTPAVAARYGGEEFVCALPDIGLNEAAEFAETLRHCLASGRIEFGGTELAVTASFGVAALTAETDEPAELFRQADTALYAAKRGGRNRVCVESGAVANGPKNHPNENAPQHGTHRSTPGLTPFEALPVASPVAT